MTIESDLITICTASGQRIKGLTHDGQPVDGGRLLLTITGIESDFGRQREYVRYEKAFGPGGKYYLDNPGLRKEYKRWGCLAASSFGAFQLMYITATELGFSGHPIQLQKDIICAEWATELIIQRFIGRHKAKTLRDILDAYNSGYHADKYLPSLYIEKGITTFENLPNTR